MSIFYKVYAWGLVRGMLNACRASLHVHSSRVESQVNRLLAVAAGWKNIVQIGITSLTIVNLSILGLLIPVYWMRRKKAENME